MERKQASSLGIALIATVTGIGAIVAACGGAGTGNERDSGANKTYLSVDATDPDGDTLTYQWRVTAGTIDNANAHEAVWTMPDGPGLHFAYVMVSDGRGGYAEQQYAVSTDALGTSAAVRTAVHYPIEASALDPDGTAVRLRLRQQGPLYFSGAASANERTVYLPDVAVRVADPARAVVFSGITDINGEVNLPHLPRLLTGRYAIQCSATPGVPDCGTFEIKTESALVEEFDIAADAGNNLRLHGHVSLGDESVCGTQSAFFNVQTTATVQLLQSNGQALSEPRRVNRFGDYSIQAAVSVDRPLIARIMCGTDTHDITLDPTSDANLRNALVNALSIERSYRFTNGRPSISRMVATGADGNVRGRMVVEEAGATSNGLPGETRFLSYKGTDTALSACMYYRSIGALAGCDAQGQMQGAISFDDWKTYHGFGANPTPDASATYVNQRDLNLVRRMVATKKSDKQIAFYVCNNPGPEGRTQKEIDEVIDFGVAAERRVACVAMEWSTTQGVNKGGVNNDEQPFTKFLSFAPDGSLIASVNLDSRGEKYMPGACIACHGGSRIGARFPENGNPTPLLGARFLPFDTGNYLFSSRGGLTESTQHAAFHALNQLVVDTEGPAADTATTRLVRGWYPNGATELDKTFVPGGPTLATGWHESTDKASFYREVIAKSCRTCHTALGNDFDWDGKPEKFGRSATGDFDPVVVAHVCGGTKELAFNASMPNALVTLNRLLVDNPPNGPVRGFMETYLGCREPASDPVYPRR